MLVLGHMNRYVIEYELSSGTKGIADHPLREDIYNERGRKHNLRRVS
jgi:hypothetical protein